MKRYSPICKLFIVSCYLVIIPQVSAKLRNILTRSKCTYIVKHNILGQITIINIKQYIIHQTQIIKMMKHVVWRWPFRSDFTLFISKMFTHQYLEQTTGLRDLKCWWYIIYMLWYRGGHEGM